MHLVPRWDNHWADKVVCPIVTNPQNIHIKYPQKVKFAGGGGVGGEGVGWRKGAGPGLPLCVCVCVCVCACVCLRECI